MKLIHLHEGLGNQMFQYAFAISLGKDIWFRDEFRNDNIRNLELNKLNCKLRYKTSMIFKILHPLSINLKKFKIIDDDCAFKYNPQFYDLKDSKIYFKGYFQNENYFRHLRPRLLKDFTMKKPFYENNKKILYDIKNSNSVSVHIRRTDYLMHKEFYGETDLSYYKKAFEFLANKISNPVFFFFSDDMEYVKKHFRNFQYPFHFVDINSGENSYKDMFLMKECRHNIITNSTFSWWAAWLNENPDKIVICPKYWVKDDIYSENLLLNEWNRI